MFIENIFGNARVLVWSANSHILLLLLLLDVETVNLFASEALYIILAFRLIEPALR